MIKPFILLISGGLCAILGCMSHQYSGVAAGYILIVLSLVSFIEEINKKDEP